MFKNWAQINRRKWLSIHQARGKSAEQASKRQENIDDNFFLFRFVGMTAMRTVYGVSAVRFDWSTGGVSIWAQSLLVFIIRDRVLYDLVSAYFIVELLCYRFVFINIIHATFIFSFLKELPANKLTHKHTYWHAYDNRQSD